MALEYTRQGIITVAMENPATNELDDPVRPGRGPELIMNSLWVGRPYEGISVFQKLCVLRWLQQQPYVDAGRIAVSGHSLGAKPALILGVLDPTLKAVVWNDGITSWRERAVATNLHRIGGWHYVPGMLAWFDYHPDLEAALAPRPFLATEGGRGPILDRIREAYRLLGAPEHYSILHGDYRSDNLLFDPDRTEVTVVDWQTLAVGLPARDLSYFMATSLHPADRAEGERDLIRLYHQALSGQGVTGYDIETCWEDYCFGMLQVPLIATLGYAFSAATDRGDQMTLTMLERGCRAIRDLGTLDMVRARV